MKIGWVKIFRELVANVFDTVENEVISSQALNHKVFFRQDQR